MPSLEALARRLGDRATVLAVSVDENWEAISKFFPHGTPLTVLLDPSREVPASYGTSQFPESFLIDPSGHVRYAFINQRNWVRPRSRRLHRGRQIGSLFTTESTENTEVGKQEGVGPDRTQPFPFRFGSVTSVSSV